MKTVILIISLMYNAFLFGQMKVDKPVGKKDTVLVIYDSIWIDDYEHSSWRGLPKKLPLFDSVTVYGNEEPVYHRKKDTVLVEAFVTDTFYRPHAPSYSLKLYSVRELHNLNEIELLNGAISYGNYNDSDFDYWEHLYYLDENKKQISKSIVVWDAKEIR